MSAPECSLDVRTENQDQHCARFVVAGQHAHTKFVIAGAEQKPLGISSGFTVPGLRLMHCDTLEVFANRPGSLATPEERRAALGVGLLLRTAVFAHGNACGCTKAEILAINDDGAHADIFLDVIWWARCAKRTTAMPPVSCLPVRLLLHSG